MPFDEGRYRERDDPLKKLDKVIALLVTEDYPAGDDVFGVRCGQKTRRRSSRHPFSGPSGR
jgi:hypothetical protein